MPDSLAYCGLNRIFNQLTTIEQNTKLHLVKENLKRQFHEFGVDGCIKRFGENQFICSQSCQYSLEDNSINKKYSKSF